jgi:hypothetical protein
MSFDGEDTLVEAGAVVAPLSQADFDRGLLRALESSLAEAQGKRFFFELPDPPTGLTKALYDAFRTHVERHAFTRLEEVQAWLSEKQSEHSGVAEAELAAKRFLWQVRQDVCSCPIDWGGRRAVGEVG